MVLKRLLPVCLCLLLTSCSNAFVYNQLDWLIPWYMGDYVNLTRDQKKSLKQELQPLLQWHREEELQSYLIILEGIESDLDQPVDSAVIKAWTDELLVAYTRLEERSLDLAFTLGEQMSDAQLADFMGELYEEQADLEEEYLGRTDAEFREQTFENFEDGLKSFMGKLQPEQKQLLQEAAADMHRFDEAWLQQRRKWLAQTEELLEREPGWQQRARDILDQRESHQSEEYVAANVHNEQVIYQVLAAVIDSRNDKQDRRVRKELGGFKRDLNKLIAREKS
ncbi:hypothetical protein EYC98_03450 [Halieaceae bacterium IMCC14734]|uniref:Lipoprotein n=1 Tax=Candidatus Litorirhabdus singularis TaxID=2518993 RepID=A0ABT3TCA1_9GAMM|nr:DUF6279 family lipoprotein [Candidatus Litorirhabdus singularis]MCX2979915.1 hypothetical protein [Candidatus Litorirhabdus singularis]